MYSLSRNQQSQQAFLASCQAQGERGEKMIGETLDSLPPEFLYLENINLCDKGDIDKVVVGPTGIWTIEVKNHFGGEITFDGKQLLRNGVPFEKDYIKQAWAEALSVRGLLRKAGFEDCNVQPVICFCYSKVRFGQQKIQGVYVIGSTWLNDLIENKVEQSLTNYTVESVTELIRSSSSGGVQKRF